MKLPISDQFLFDIYNVLEKAGDVSHFIFRRRRTMRDIFPENPVVRKYKKMITRHQFNMLVYRLKRNNLIKVKNLEGKKAIMLTKRGLGKALKASFKIESQKKQKREDGKWIMIIFDIPQNSWKARTLLKSVLLNLGYKKFQQSVWITPYDVFEKTEKLLQFYFLDRYVRIFLIEKLS